MDERKKIPLYNLAVKGVFWLICAQVIIAGSLFFGNIFYARLLSPKDFGLIGLTVSLMSLMTGFSRTGIDLALIQKKDEYEKYLNTAWTIEAVRGLIIFVILCLLAPFLAKFFNESSINKIVCVMGVGFLFQGFTNIGAVLFRKNLNFYKQFILSSFPVIIGTMVGVVLAFVLKNVWAIVAGSLTGGFLKLALSYILHPYKPRVEIDPKKLLELLNFGKWMFGLGILFFLTSRLDNLVVGKIMGMTALGLYAYSFNLATLIPKRLYTIFGNTTFSAFSKIQDDIDRLKKAFFNTMESVSFIMFFFTAILLIFIPDLVRLILGNKWIPIIPVVRVLCFAAAFQWTVIGSHFMAMGCPDKKFKINLIRTVSVLILIVPLTVILGIFGTALSVMVAHLIAFVIWFVYSKKLLECKYTDILSCFCPAFCVTSITGILIVIIRRFRGDVGFSASILHFMVFIILYISFSYLVCKLWRKDFLKNLIYISKSISEF